MSVVQVVAAVGVGLGAAYAWDRWLKSEIPPSVPGVLNPSEVVDRTRELPSKIKEAIANFASKAGPTYSTPKPAPFPGFDPNPKKGQVAQETPSQVLSKIAVNIFRPRLTVASFPGAKQIEASEPGFFQALKRLCDDTGAPFYKLCAYMSWRSGFNPSHSPGGLMGLETSQWPGVFGASWTPDSIPSMSGIAQVEGPIRALFTAYPNAAKGPALFILGPALAEKYSGKSGTIAVWSKVWVNDDTDPAQMMFSEFDRDKNGVTTLKDIRDTGYQYLNSNWPASFKV